MNDDPTFKSGSEPPKGLRFTHLYQKRGEPLQDSARMRRRYSALVRDTHGLGDLDREVEKELGISVGLQGWHKFFERCELSDLLDSVTIAYRLLSRGARSERYSLVKPNEWLISVQRIFAEENIHYTVDNRGGVHFTFDREFDENRASAIAALNSPRYANVLAEFEQVDVRLTEVPPNGKGAIRAIFSAAEGLFRLMFPDAPRLGAKEIEKYLMPPLQQALADDVTASGATSKVLQSFKDWVDAAHFYRHEPGKEEIAQPPLPLAINIVSVGASYVRWLGEVDADLGPRLRKP